jgi:hypothetical protein
LKWLHNPFIFLLIEQELLTMQYEELIYISEDMDLENTHTFLLLAFGMV